MVENNVSLYLGDGVASFKETENGVAVVLAQRQRAGNRYGEYEVSGVRPGTSLAKEAGLALGKLGGIEVNEYMQTSDRNIHAHWVMPLR